MDHVSSQCSITSWMEWALSQPHRSRLNAASKMSNEVLNIFRRILVLLESAIYSKIVSYFNAHAPSMQNGWKKITPLRASSHWVLHNIAMKPGIEYKISLVDFKQSGWGIHIPTELAHTMASWQYRSRFSVQPDSQWLLKVGDRLQWWVPRIEGQPSGNRMWMLKKHKRPIWTDFELLILLSPSSRDLGVLRRVPIARWRQW